MGFWFLKTKTKRSNESPKFFFCFFFFFINEAPEQQRPSGYWRSPRAIVWTRTMTQQEGVEQRSVKLQARSPAGADELAGFSKPEKTHTHTHTHRWVNGTLKLLSIRLWIILIIPKKVMILILVGFGWECLCVWLMLISVCSTSPVCQCQAADPAGRRRVQSCSNSSIKDFTFII